MERFSKLALALPVAALLALAACVDDLPSHTPPAAVEAPLEIASTQETQIEPEAAPTQAESEPMRNRMQRGLLVQLTEELHIYPWPRRDLEPFLRYHPRVLLLFDAWVEVEEETWVRLDLNGDVDGWVPLNESPLTELEATTLQRLDVPELPTASLVGPGGDAIEVTLLGRSEDGVRAAARIAGSDAAFWVEMQLLEAEQQLDWLPIFRGAVWGEWNPPFDPPVVVARAIWAGTDIYSSPDGDRSGYRIHAVPEGYGRPANDFAVMGRSLDGDWIAVRLDDFDPAVGWVLLEQIELNADPETLPYFLAGETAVIELGGDGGIVGQLQRERRLYRWQWRDDGGIVGSNDGLWLWHPDSGDDAVPFAPSQWVTFSPDGRYAASGTAPNYENGDLTRDITITDVDSGETQTFIDAGAFYFTHHDSDPSLIWSSDSRHLVSIFSPLIDPDVDAWRGFFVLGVDGSRTAFDGSISGDFRFWLPDGALVTRREDQFSVFSTDGARLRDLPDLPSLSASVSHGFAIANTGRPLGWKRFNLLTGETAPLPSPLDEPYWGLRDLSGKMALFVRANAEFIEAVAYNGIAHESHVLVAEKDAIQRPEPFWPSPLWSPTGTQVALLLETGRGLSIDLSTGDIRTLPLPPSVDWPDRDELVDWSPDGALLLTRSLRILDRNDADGVATHPPRWSYVGPPRHAVSEYRLISVATGRVLARFRAAPDYCWSNDGTAAFSPDGRWLAFSGRYTDCT